MRTLTLFGISFASMLAVTAASAQARDAVAEPSREASQVTVRIADESQDPASSKLVYADLSRAANKACDSDRADLWARTADAACARQALARAVLQLDRPALTALHTGVVPTRLASR